MDRITKQSVTAFSNKLNQSVLNYGLVLYLHSQMFIVRCRKNIRVEIRQQKEWIALSYIKNYPCQV